MNVHEAVRKYYGDGNLLDLRLFVQLGSERPRRVSIVNKGGMALRSYDATDGGRALYKTTFHHVYKVSMRNNQLVGHDTILHTKEFLS